MTNKKKKIKKKKHSEYQSEGLRFQVGRLGFSLRFSKDVPTAQDARKHLPSAYGET